MKVSGVVLCCVLSMAAMAAQVQRVQAQMTMAPAASAAPGSTATPAQAFDGQLSMVEHEMMGAVKAMPADKFSFAPSAAIFVPAQKTEFATVRTFAQQAIHVAQANYSFARAYGGMKPDIDPKSLTALTSKDDVVAALAASFVFAHKALSGITAANAFEALKSDEPGVATRATMASFCVSHAFDHYGQMVEYLRMNGIVPPASAK